MIYINNKPNPSGAYGNPKNQPFTGCIPLSDEQAKIFLEYNGFVTVTVEGESVKVEPNVMAWEEWKENNATETVEPEEKEPTIEDLVNAMLGV